MSAMGLVVTLGATPAHAEYSENPRQTWQVSNGRVNAIAVRGDRVYIGGTFTAVRNPATGQRVTRTRIAAFDRVTGDLVMGFDPSANDDVRALAVSEDGTTVFVGGDFTNVNGASRGRIAAVDRTGGIVPFFNADANRTVSDLVVSGGALFAGGTFSSINGARRVHLARVSTLTGDVSSWRADATLGRVFGIALTANGSQLVAGGNFNRVGGQDRDMLASVSAVNGDVSSWNPAEVCDTCTVFDVTTGGTDGVYAAVGGPGGRGVGYSMNSNSIRWARGADGDVQAVAYHEGVAYFGGHFGPNFGGGNRHQLAAVSAGSGSLLGFSPNFTGNDKPGMWAVVADQDYLRAGGGFRGISGGSQQRYAEFPYR